MVPNLGNGTKKIKESKQQHTGKGNLKCFVSIYLGYLARKKNIVFQIFAILFQVIFDKFIAQYKTFSIIKKNILKLNSSIAQ